MISNNSIGCFGALDGFTFQTMAGSFRGIQRFGQAFAEFFRSVADCVLPAVSELVS